LTCNLTFASELRETAHLGGRCLSGDEVLPAVIEEIPPSYEHTFWASVHLLEEYAEDVADALVSRWFADDLAEMLHDAGDFAAKVLDVRNVSSPVLNRLEAARTPQEAFLASFSLVATGVDIHVFDAARAKTAIAAAAGVSEASLNLISLNQLEPYENTTARDATAEQAPEAPGCILGCRMVDLVNTGVVDDCAVTSSWFDHAVSNCLDDCSVHEYQAMVDMNAYFCDEADDADDATAESSTVSVMSVSFVFYGDSVAHAREVAKALVGLDVVNATHAMAFDLQGIDEISVFHVFQNQTAVRKLGPLSNFPTDSPTLTPTSAPTDNPTVVPTLVPTSLPTDEPIIATYTVGLTGTEALASYDAGSFTAAFADAIGLDAGALTTEAALQQTMELTGINITLNNETIAVLVASVAGATGVEAADVELVGASATSISTSTGGRRLLQESLLIDMVIAVADGTSVVALAAAAADAGEHVAENLAEAGVDVSVAINVTGLVVEVAARIDSANEFHALEQGDAFVAALAASLETAGIILPEGSLAVAVMEVTGLAPTSAPTLRDYAGSMGDLESVLGGSYAGSYGASEFPDSMASDLYSQIFSHGSYVDGNNEYGLSDGGFSYGSGEFGLSDGDFVAPDGGFVEAGLGNVFGSYSSYGSYGEEYESSQVSASTRRRARRLLFSDETMGEITFQVRVVSHDMVPPAAALWRVIIEGLLTFTKGAVPESSDVDGGGGFGDGSYADFEGSYGEEEGAIEPPVVVYISVSAADILRNTTEFAGDTFLELTCFPTKAGAVTFQPLVWYDSDLTLVPFADVPSYTTPTTISGETSVLSCADTGVAGYKIECGFAGMDVYGNAQGRGRDQDDLHLVTLTNSSQLLHPENLEFESFGRFEGSVVSYRSGVVQVVVTYDTTPQWPGSRLNDTVATTSVDVVSDRPVAVNSSFVCPDSVIAYAAASCVVYLVDQYGNAVVPSQEGISQLTAQVAHGQIPVATSFVIKGSSILLSYRVPSVGPLSVSVQYGTDYALVLGGPNPVFVDVEFVAIDNDASTAACAPESITAGDEVTCTLHLFNETGSPVGDAFFVGAFSVMIKDGAKTAPLEEDILFLDTGVFEFSFSPRFAGFAQFEIGYFSTGGITQIGSNATIFVGVEAAAVHAASSSLAVAELTTAGQLFEIEAAGFDRYGNVQNELTDNQTFAVVLVSPAGALANSTVTLALNQTVEGGLHRVAANLTLAGTWNATLRLVEEDGYVSEGHSVAFSLTGAAVVQQNSFLDCPPSVPAFSHGSCLLHARDAFDNPTSGISPMETANAMFIHGLQGAVELQSFVAPDGAVGLFVGTFVSPTPGFVLVSSGLLSTGGLRYFGGDNPQNVTVLDVPIAFDDSSFVCSATAVVAGDVVHCNVTLVDFDGEPVGTPGFASIFAASATNNGVRLSFSGDSFTYVTVGKFTLTFVPEIAGDLLLSIALQSSNGLTDLRMADSSAFATVDVAAGPVSAARSFVDCRMYTHFQAGYTFTCIAHTKDVYGNSQGSEAVLDHLVVSVYSLDDAAAHAMTLTWTKLGSTKCEFVINIVGTWTVVGQYDGDVLGTSAVPISAVSSVTVFGGDVSVANSFVECPASSAAFASGMCAIYAYDSFGNPTSGMNPDTLASSIFLRAVQDDQQLQSSVASAGGTTGLFTGTFLSPLPGYVLVYGGLLAEGGFEEFGGQNPHNVTILNLPIDYDNSTFVCSTSSPVAGDTVVCKVYLVDLDGQPVGEASILSIFAADVINKGVRLSFSGSSSFVYIADGEFELRFVPEIGGDLQLSVSVQSSNGPTALTMADDSTWAIMAVSAGPLSASRSFIDCKPYAHFQAGSTFTCVVYGKDAYGNVQGDVGAVDDLAVFAYSPDGEANAMSLTWTKLGSTKCEFVIEAIGVWTVAGQYNGDSLGTSAAVPATVGSVIVFGGELSTSDSYMTCPESSAAYASGSCAISAFDSYRNPTSGVDAAATASSLFLRALQNGAELQSVVVVAAGAEAGSFMGTFLSPLPGDVVVYGGFLGTDGLTEFGGDVPQTVAIVDVPIEYSASTFVCPTADILAGGKLTCKITLVGTDGDKVGESNFRLALTVVVLNQGLTVPVDPSTDIRFVTTGEYTVDFVAVKSGQVTAQAFVKLQHDLFLISGADDVSVSVLPADIDTSACEVVCTSERVVVATELVCSVFVRDAYLNAQGTEVDLTALQVVARVGDSDEITLALRFVEVGVYEASFHPVMSGEWIFSGTFNGESLGGGGSGDSTDVNGDTAVQVIGGVVSPPESYFDCPSATAASGRLHCAIYARDEYGNPTDGDSAVQTASQFFASSEQLAIGALIEIMPAEMYMSMEEIVVNAARADHGAHSGTYVASISVPVLSSLTVSVIFVEATQQTVLGGVTPQEVVIEQADIDASASSVVCPKTATAGEPVTCQIFVVDSDGNSVGTSGLMGAFSADAVNVGRPLAVQFQFIQVALNFLPRPCLPIHPPFFTFPSPSFLSSFTFLPTFLHLPSYLPSFTFLPPFTFLPSFLHLPSFLLLPYFHRHLPSLRPSFFSFLPSFLPAFLTSPSSFLRHLPSLRPSLLPSFLHHPPFLRHFPSLRPSSSLSFPSSFALPSFP
jgi:hypothetical protein